MIPGLRVARYLVVDEPLPPAAETGYDYVLAGNGLFKRARNRHVEVMACIAPARVAGLREATPYLRLRRERLPEPFLYKALADAQRRSRLAPTEAMYHVACENGRARLVRPMQQAAGGGIAYQGGDSPAIVCDLHSHHQMRAFFSPTDDRDELGFRFYAVMGRIYTRPQIALRLGVWGDFVRIPVEALFAGPGPFEDASV